VHRPVIHTEVVRWKCTLAGPPREDLTVRRQLVTVKTKSALGTRRDPPEGSKPPRQPGSSDGHRSSVRPVRVRVTSEVLQ
jgi:hypothetical protein